MSEQAHTPGPWSCADGDASGFKTGSGGESILATARPSDDYFVLKIAEMDSNVPVDERTANARLIAAAPDLLEALQVIVTDCSQIWTAAEFPALAKAREALLRATPSKSGGK